ncbi:MAG: arylesterase [Janthinobacterium lividum]
MRNMPITLALPGRRKTMLAAVLASGLIQLIAGAPAAAASAVAAATPAMATSATSTPKSAVNTVLVMGDSLSAEYGITRGTGWVPLMEQRLKKENIAAAVVNASISGETTSGGLARLQPLLDKVRPQTVVIELGANDGLRGLPIAATQNNLRALIDASHKANAKVLLVGMQLPPNYGGDYTRQFTGMYPKLATSAGVALVPFMFTGVDKPSFFQADRLHPTAEAQPTILENIWPHLKPLLTSAAMQAQKAPAALAR